MLPEASSVTTKCLLAVHLSHKKLTTLYHVRLPECLLSTRWFYVVGAT